ERSERSRDLESVASPDKRRQNDLRRDQLAPRRLRRQKQQARDRQRRHRTKTSRRETTTSAHVAATVGDGVAADVQRDRLPSAHRRSCGKYQTIEPGGGADRRHRGGTDPRENSRRARRKPAVEKGRRN